MILVFYKERDDKIMFYKAKKIILNNRTEFNSYLEVRQDGTFGRVTKELPKDNNVNEDYADKIIAPGLVDTHIHGYAGHDVMDASFEALDAMSAGLPSCGVTSWLPTSLTDSTENLNKACEVIGKYHNQVSGAKIQGIFLEGPFFTEEHKGAQNPKYMSDPSLEKLTTWDNLSNHLVRKIAIAPERNGVIQFVQGAKKMDIHTALAHSSATYDQAKVAVDAGASIFIHTYNGMSGLHHREPGMVGAALTLDETYAEVISDGHHVHPVAIKVITNVKPKDKVVLVTDCMRAGGKGEGDSKLGEFDVVVKDGAARLKEGGSLAGSVLELIDSVQNMVKWGIVSLDDAVRMATINAAKSVGIEDVCGSIQENRPADFIVLDDSGELFNTYINGKQVYSRG